MIDTHKIQEKFVDIDGIKIHYLEAGEGKPMLFLHGVPTSSYVWRKVIPYLANLRRCLALDLVGFGKSDKPDIDYQIADHIHYVESFIKKSGLKQIVLVMHGLGSVIGLDIAMRHQNLFSGLVMYESFLRPIDEKRETSLPFIEQVEMAYENNELEANIEGITFVDRLLSQQMMEQISAEAREVYNQPFSDKQSVKPLTQYFKALKDEKSKLQINQYIADYGQQLKSSKIPKLLLYSVPGFLTTMDDVMWAKKNIAHLEVIDLGEELHLVQESNPKLIGQSISAWMQGIETF